MKINKLSKNQIRALLVERGISQNDIASKLGVTPAAVSWVISGRNKTPHIRREIANTAGIPYAKMWGNDDLSAAPFKTVVKKNSKSTMFITKMRPNGLYSK